MTTTIDRGPKQGYEVLYRFEGNFNQIIPVGPVADGFRLDGHFGGSLTYGDLTGAELVGVDYFRIRGDGVGIVTANEVIRLGDTVITAELHGYLLPPTGIDAPVPSDIVAPGFTWPTQPYTIHVAATFETAAPEHTELNRTIVAHTGTVNFANGTLSVEARRIG